MSDPTEGDRPEREDEGGVGVNEVSDASEVVAETSPGGNGETIEGDLHEETVESNLDSTTHNAGGAMPSVTEDAPSSDVRDTETPRVPPQSASQDPQQSAHQDANEDLDNAESGEQGGRGDTVEPPEAADNEPGENTSVMHDTVHMETDVSPEPDPRPEPIPPEVSSDADTGREEQPATDHDIPSAPAGDVLDSSEPQPALITEDPRPSFTQPDTSGNPSSTDGRRPNTVRFADKPALPPLPTYDSFLSDREAEGTTRWSTSTDDDAETTSTGGLYSEHETTRTDSAQRGSEDRSEHPDVSGGEDDDTAIMDPDNPLMARVQTALKKQLTEHLERITLDLREKESAVRAAIQRRETIGVELYNLQQQLAKQQAALDSAQEQLGMVQSGRQEAEGKLQNVNEEWKEIKDRCRKGERSLDQHKSEMERISRAIKQVDLYNDELRSKILVAKRGTMKAEEDLVKQEQEKKRQDYFIDTLTEQLRKLQERRALYETQLLAQQKETRAALDTLQEAGLEMEAIQFEKRQLLHHWKSSLIGLQRREETLQALSAQIQTQKDTLLSMTNELNGFRHSLRAAQETNESLTVLLNKLEKEIERMKREIGRLEAEKDKMKESYGTWSKMLRQTEGELGVVMQERQTLQAELASIQKQTLQTHAATQNLQSQIAELLQNQLSLVKGNQSTRRELTTTLRHEIHEKESVIASVQNDLASTRLEGLNITARVKGMKEQLENLDREITQRNKELERYEVEIRRGNDELTKKQGEMDALNRKYDRLIAKSQDESTGPLEATIHNLLKSLALKQKETVQLSQFWLTSQTHLVHLTKKTSAISESTQDARMKLTVLNRKKMVVDSAFENECKEIKEYQRSIRGLRVQMEKVNGLLGRQVKEQNRLEEGNLGLEQEFRGRLKDAELESLHMEQQLEHLKSEKQKALQGLIEAERQLLLWQKKTQLARETQLALDPNVGAIEIKEMQAEIHRMKLRHASMLKLQEKMVSEMERSVWRRESIHQRVTGGGTTKGVAKKTSGGVMIQKEIVELGRRVKRVLDDLRECDEDMKSLTTSRHQMTHQITQAKQSLSQLISKQEDLQTQLEDLQTEKNLLTSQTLLHQRSARRYTLVTPSTTTTNNNNTSNTNTTTPRYTYYIKDPALRPSELESQQLRLSKIQSVIQTVASEVGDARIKMALDGVGRLVATNNQ